MSSRIACLFLISSICLSCKTDKPEIQEKPTKTSVETTNEVAAVKNAGMENTAESQPAKFEKIIPPADEISSEKAVQKPTNDKTVKAENKQKKKKKKVKKRLPKIEFETLVYDFGTITEGDTIAFDFKYKNTGKSDLTVETANATCGCARPSFSFLPLPPGKVDKIGVKFISLNKSGEQNPEITIVSDGSKDPIILRLNGFVEDRPKEEEKPVKIDTIVPDTLPNKGD